MTTPAQMRDAAVSLAKAIRPTLMGTTAQRQVGTPATSAGGSVTRTYANSGTPLAAEVATPSPGEAHLAYPSGVGLVMPEAVIRLPAGSVVNVGDRLVTPARTYDVVSAPPEGTHNTVRVIGANPI